MVSVLDIVTQAASELGLPVPAQLAGSGIPQNRQLLAHANASGRWLVRRHPWGALTQLGTITTMAGTSDYAPAADFDRMISDTEWDESTSWKVIGAITPQTDRAIRESGIASPGGRRRFRQLGAKIRVTPTPPDSGATLVYEYVSNLWALSSAGTPQASFLADTDTCVFDFDLMVKSVKFFFTEAKGLPTASGFFIAREQLADLRIAADIGGTTLNMSGRKGDGGSDLQDPSWNVIGTNERIFDTEDFGSLPSDPVSSVIDLGTVP